MPEFTDAVNTMLEKRVGPAAPGCALAVIHKDEVIHAQGYGLANLAHGIPITTNTSFYAASLAKQFTGCCIALLLEKGALSLQDDVKKYVPGLPDYDHTLTIRHLLHHTSGLPDYIQLYFALGFRDNQELDPFTNQDAFEMLTRQKRLQFAPGENYQYSNSGYFLLGKVIERITQQAFHAFARQEIFAPLGMTHTFFLENSAQVIPRNAIGYERLGEGAFGVHTTTSSIVAASGLITTVDDLGKWAKNMSRNSLGKGSQELIDVITRAGTLNDGSSCNYGFGLVVGEHQGLRHIYHVGQFAALTSVLHHFPEQQVSVALLTNLAGFEIVHTGLEIAERFLHRLGLPLPRPTTEPETRPEPAERVVHVASPVQLLAGIYRSVKTNQVVTFEVRDGELLFCVPAYECEKDVYRPVSATRFELKRRGTSEILPSPEIEFVVDERDPQKVDLYFVYSPDARSHYKKFVPVELSQQGLLAYTGAYYSAELDAFFIIRASQRGLVLRLPTLRNKPLFYVDQDEFLKDLDWLDFQRDSDGVIEGFYLYNFNARLNPENASGPYFRRVPVSLESR